MWSWVGNTAVKSVLLTLFPAKHWKHNSVCHPIKASEKSLQRSTKRPVVPSMLSGSSDEKTATRKTTPSLWSVLAHCPPAPGRPQHESNCWRPFVYSGVWKGSVNIWNVDIHVSVTQATPKAGRAFYGFFLLSNTRTHSSDTQNQDQVHCPTGIWIHTGSVGHGCDGPKLVLRTCWGLVSQRSGLLSPMRRLHWALLVWEPRFHGDNQGSQWGIACHWLQFSWEQRKHRGGGGFIKGFRQIIQLLICQNSLSTVKSMTQHFVT